MGPRLRRQRGESIRLGAALAACVVSAPIQLGTIYSLTQHHRCIVRLDFVSSGSEKCFHCQAARAWSTSAASGWCLTVLRSQWQASRLSLFANQHMQSHDQAERLPNLQLSRGRNPIEAEHVKATAHLSNLIGAVVQTILLRAAEVPIYARHWALSACIYSAFFSVSRVCRSQTPAKLSCKLAQCAVCNTCQHSSVCTLKCCSPSSLARVRLP